MKWAVHRLQRAHTLMLHSLITTHASTATQTTLHLCLRTRRPVCHHAPDLHLHSAVIASRHPEATLTLMIGKSTASHADVAAGERASDDGELALVGHVVIKAVKAARPVAAARP